jgi:hypothetical protein
MITVRKLLTKEICNKFNETNILSDEDAIAWVDTFKALEVLFDYPIFSLFRMDSIYHRYTGLEKRVDEIKQNPDTRYEITISDSDIMSKELCNRFITNEWSLTIEEIQLITNHLFKLVELTEFDSVRYITLHEWIMYKTELLTKISLSKRVK